MTEDPKNALTQSSHIAYQSSLELKNFVRLKEEKLFYLVIKQAKPFSVPKVCTG